MAKAITQLKVKNSDGKFTDIPIGIKAENIKLNNGKDLETSVVFLDENSDTTEIDKYKTPLYQEDVVDNLISKSNIIPLSAKQGKILNERINQISNFDGTLSDLEIADLRVGANGQTYNSAGEAVRENFNLVNEDINKKENLNRKIRRKTSGGTYETASSLAYYPSIEYLEDYYYDASEVEYMIEEAKSSLGTQESAELKDLRKGADGLLYETAGAAVRSNTKELKNDLNQKITLLNLNQEDINTTLSGKADKDTTYTKTEIDTKLSVKLDNTKGSVKTDNIANGAVSSEKLAKNAVTEEKILMGAVTNTKLATDSVSVTKIQNGVVSADKLANGAVITDKLRDASVTTVKINPGAVTNTRLADGAVSKEKLDENLMPLIGKAIYQNGDSVAAGDGANGNSYFDIIADKYSMVKTDDSIGGTTIAVSDFNIKTLSDGTKKDYKSIYERVQETMVGNFDYIILEGGWNDMFASVPLGSLTEHYVQNIEDLNVETTIGATEAICKLLIDRYFDIPKLFILGHKKIDWKQETDWLPRQNAYWNGIISALEKWGIPYVDLRYESNLAAWNQTIADTYFYHKVVDGVDQGGDGTHPNYEAYKKFYVPPIEKALLYGVNTQPKKSLISHTLGDALIPEMSYYLGEQSEVTLAFPSKIKTTGSEIYINFISGETATTVISANCIGLENFVPNPKSVCEIHAQYNGSYWVCLTSQTEVSL